MGRISSFDYARGIAIIAVTFGHATLLYMVKPTHIFIDSFLHNLAIFSVPLFLFMSGYLLAFKQQMRFWDFYKSKLQRIYIPTIVWIVGFWLLFALWGGNETISIPLVFQSIVLMLYSWQYYYIFVLMLLFIIGFFAVQGDNNRLRTYVRISFVINLLLVAFYQYELWSGQSFLSIPYLRYHNPFAWVFFFIWGIYVRRVDPKLSNGWFRLLSNHKLIGIGLTLLLWLLTSLETWLLFVNHGEPRSGMEFFKVSAFFFEILSLSYVLILLNNVKQENFAWRWLRFLGNYSFFIFLIHIPLVPRILGWQWFENMDTSAYYVNVLLLGTLQLLVPVAVALAIGLLKNFPFVDTFSRYLGLPVMK